MAFNVPEGALRLEFLHFAAVNQAGLVGQRFGAAAALLGGLAAMKSPVFGMVVQSRPRYAGLKSGVWSFYIF